MRIRPRRNRVSEGIRAMVRESVLLPTDLIAPLFVVSGKNVKQEISSMPGQYRYSIDMLVKEVKTVASLGIPAVSLFPAINDSLKDTKGSESLNPSGLFPRAISAVKEAVPEIVVMSDVALDPYSSDGHDGVVDSKSGKILNDETLEILAQMSIVQAKAGSDIIGPSDMMDGRVNYIRNALEKEGLVDTLIMSYSAKYASSFYGPFRDALSSAPKSGDKKTYQMDFCNVKEAIKEALLDEEEGADILMVKPGLSYLDVIAKIKESTNLPIAAYNVSGEYAMVKAAAQRGWLDEQKVMMEMLYSFKRAGADIILTYFAIEAAKVLNK